MNLGQFWKKKIAREITFPSSPHCWRLLWSGVFSVFGLAFWNDWASSFLFSPMGTLVTQERALGELSRSVQEHTCSLVNPERPWPPESPVHVSALLFVHTEPWLHNEKPTQPSPLQSPWSMSKHL